MSNENDQGAVEGYLRGGHRDESLECTKDLSIRGVVGNLIRLKEESSIVICRRI